MIVKVKKAHNEIAVYFSEYFNCWMMHNDFCIEPVGTYKQAKIEARKVLWKQGKGSIFYSRKSDGLVTKEEYIGKNNKGWSEIKGQRMNLKKAA
jgi:hypothetical protein